MDVARKVGSPFAMGKAGKLPFILTLFMASLHFCSLVVSDDMLT
jgi:hypothetical protein